MPPFTGVRDPVPAGAIDLSDLNFDPATQAEAEALIAALSATYVSQGSPVISTNDAVFGAVGDGVADDTAALDAFFTALAASPGARGVIADGTYKITTQLAATLSDVTLEATGAQILHTLVAETGAAVLTITTSGGFRLRGLRITPATVPDTQADTKVLYQHALDVRGPAADNHGTFCEIADCVIDGSRDHGIQVRYLDDVHILNNRVTKALATGLYVYDIHDGRIAGNTVIDTRDDNIFVSSDVGQGVPCNRVEITGNRCSDSQEKGIGTSGVLQCVIEGNLVENTYAAGIYPLQDDTFSLGVSTNVAVVGNTVRNAGKNFGAGKKHTTAGTIGRGIYVGPNHSKVSVVGNVVDAANNTAISADTGAFVAVSANVVTDPGSQGISIGSASASDALNVTDFVCASNVIHGPLNSGIVVQHASFGVVSGNTIRSWKNGGTGTQRGIYVNACANVKAHGNLLYNDTSGNQFVTIASSTNCREWGNLKAAPGDDASGSIFTIGDTRLTVGSAAPATGTWVVGDFCLNSNPTTTGVLGWRCTTAGTPGTWTSIPTQTNLGYTAAPGDGTVTSDNGNDATVPLADGTNAGLMAPAGFTKLAGIETGATADQSAAEIVALIAQPVFVGAAAIGTIGGAPTLGNSGGATAYDRTAAWLLDSAVEEVVGGAIIGPKHWATADVYAWWTVGSSAVGGQVAVLQLHHASVADGEQLNAETSEATVTGTAPGTGQMAVRTLLKAGVPITSDEVLRFSVGRLGADGSDTLTIDLALVGVEFVRAS